LVSGDTTMATLRFCPGYDLIDSSLSVIIYARDTADHYDGKQLVFSVIYFPVGESSAIQIAAYPNPFIYEAGQTVTLRLLNPDSAMADDVELFIFDAAGSLVFDSSLVGQGVFAPGEHYISWAARNNIGEPIAGGVYIIKLRVGDRSASEKIAIIR